MPCSISDNFLAYNGDMTGVKAIAEALSVNSSLKSIDLSGNRIALNGEMAGVDALAEALKVNASLNSLK